MKTLPDKREFDIMLTVATSTATDTEEKQFNRLLHNHLTDKDIDVRFDDETDKHWEVL